MCIRDSVGGEQYILSAVMHADEINRAMTEALGREVYHHHLHVVYVPVVEKQILWSKRCKDKALVGTVKEMCIRDRNSTTVSSFVEEHFLAHLVPYLILIVQFQYVV